MILTLIFGEIKHRRRQGCLLNEGARLPIGKKITQARCAYLSCGSAAPREQVPVTRSCGLLPPFPPRERGGLFFASSALGSIAQRLFNRRGGMSWLIENLILEAFLTRKHVNATRTKVPPSASQASLIWIGALPRFRFRSSSSASSRQGSIGHENEAAGAADAQLCPIQRPYGPKEFPMSALRPKVPTH